MTFCLHFTWTRPTLGMQLRAFYSRSGVLLGHAAAFQRMQRSSLSSRGGNMTSTWSFSIPQHLPRLLPGTVAVCSCAELPTPSTWKTFVMYQVADKTTHKYRMTWWQPKTKTYNTSQLHTCQLRCTYIYKLKLVTPQNISFMETRKWRRNFISTKPVAFTKRICSLFRC